MDTKSVIARFEAERQALALSFAGPAALDLRRGDNACSRPPTALRDSGFPQAGGGTRDPNQQSNKQSVNELFGQVIAWGGALKALRERRA